MGQISGLVRLAHNLFHQISRPVVSKPVVREGGLFEAQISTRLKFAWCSHRGIGGAEVQIGCSFPPPPQADPSLRPWVTYVVR